MIPAGGETRIDLPLQRAGEVEITVEAETASLPRFSDLPAPMPRIHLMPDTTDGVDGRRPPADPLPLTLFSDRVFYSAGVAPGRYRLELATLSDHARWRIRDPYIVVRAGALTRRTLVLERL